MTDSMTDCSISRRFSRPAITPARAWSMARVVRPAVQMFCDKLTPRVAPSLSDDELETWVSGTPVSSSAR